MNSLSKKLGCKIKEIRKSKNILQSELSEKIGVDSKYLSRIETGLATPSLRIVEKLASVLDVKISTLFNFEQDDDKLFLATKLKDKVSHYMKNV